MDDATLVRVVDSPRQHFDEDRGHDDPAVRDPANSHVVVRWRGACQAYVRELRAGLRA